MVGVPAAGCDGVRPRKQRGRGKGQDEEEQLREGASGDLAARVHARLLAGGAYAFTAKEPVDNFIWLFINTDGTVSEYPTEMKNYERLKALYGIPLGRWKELVR